MAAEESSTKLVVEIGSPQWCHQYESCRLVDQFLKDKLADDRQYLADPMMRAEDTAQLQNIQDMLANSNSRRSC